MDIYVDSAAMSDILEAKELGLCDGVTTNPTLIARVGNDPVGILTDIAKAVEGPVHAEVLSLEKEAILKEGRELAKISSNIVVKIPMVNEGLKAAKVFKAEGIATNITLIFSASQAILAAKAGATYICPFLGRLDDISHNGLELLSDLSDIFAINPDLDTSIIAASIRGPLHMVELAAMGIDILTAPSKVLAQMEKHPLTDSGVAAFLEDAKKFK